MALEDRPIQGGALTPVIVAGHVPVQLLNPENDLSFDTDPITGGLVMIEEPHHEVHQGEMFHAEYLWTSVANNANADFLLVTGARYPHTVFTVNAGGSCYVFFYEQVTTSNNGTLVLSYNMKRYGANTNTAVAYHTPTVVGFGFQFVSRYLPGGVGPQTRVGGGVRTGTEWILKPSLKYLVRATNVSGASIAISIAFEYYEEVHA